MSTEAATPVQQLLSLLIWGNLNIAPTLCVPSTFFSIGKGDSNSLFLSFQPPLCLPSWVQAGDRWEDEDSVSLVVPGDSHLSHFSQPRQAQPCRGTRRQGGFRPASVPTSPDLSLILGRLIWTLLLCPLPLPGVSLQPASAPPIPEERAATFPAKG